MLMAVLDTFLANILYLTLHLSSYGSFPPPLSPAEEKKYLNLMFQGDKEAHQKLIEHNLRLVAHIIKKYYSAYSEQDDLISIGTIGLIKGINSFNPEKGTKLATYTAKCIENEILMHFRSQKKNMQDISMSEPIETDSEGNPLTLIDIIRVDDTIIEDIDTRLKINKLKGYVDEITNERERKIILMRYGLCGYKGMTQREVAKHLKISRSYVSRIEKRVLKALKRRFDTEHKHKT